MAAAGIRKTKMVKVEQSYIDSLLAFRAACPPRPLFTDFIDNDVVSCEQMRRCCERAAALLKKRQDEDDEILRQYEANGSAYWEVEIRDEDEE
ncbi:hypothetical protein C2845_PM08G21090 [Panicum miliaceum]|uniref:Uncharacterized protein n=1 Tax=Panicum miliaceum TaxID=4540 RepID=A0A3L6R2R2_PANMI|nr:hypothetical protein C2845_PM08G21090 [Panicum miliaceum]